MSLPKDEVDAWANSDGLGDTLPVHEVKQRDWLGYRNDGSEKNLIYFHFLEELLYIYTIIFFRRTIEHQDTY